MANGDGCCCFWTICAVCKLRLPDRRLMVRRKVARLLDTRPTLDRWLDISPWCKDRGGEDQLQSLWTRPSDALALSPGCTWCNKGHHPANMATINPSSIHRRMVALAVVRLPTIKSRPRDVNRLGFHVFCPFMRQTNHWVNLYPKRESVAWMDGDVG